jgi:adenylate cyclase
VAGLAALLIRQGLRADANAALVLARERAREAQSAAYADLAANAALFDPGSEEGAQAMTRTLARAVGARRAGLWLLRSGGATLVCENCYDRDSDGHAAGTEFARADMPALFEALAAGEELTIADAARDRRTAALARIYLTPVGSRALLSVPVRRDGQVAGAVWAEDATAEGALSFLRAFANMLAIRLGAAEERSAPAREVAVGGARAALRAPVAAGAAVAPRAAMRNAGLVLDRTRGFLARLAADGVSAEGLAARLFRDTTVLCVRFTDPIALARGVGEDGACAVDRLACALEEVATACGIDYAKLVGEQIVIAAGFGEDAAAHAVAVAEAALAMQEVSARVFTDLGRRLEFRMGLDTGTVMGSAVGAEDRSFNLWGEATRTAAQLADSAPPGAIQASESAYRLLRDVFLFRARGAFYVDRAGELSTYLLTGRT